MNNRGTLIPKLQAVFATKSYEEWEKLLLANDIPVGAINDIGQVVEHPQVQARKAFIETDHPTVGKVRGVGSPVRLSKTPAVVKSPAPTHGQPTREVLRDVLKFDEAQIAALTQKGVVK